MGSPNHTSANGPPEDFVSFFFDDPHETSDDFLDRFSPPPADHQSLPTLGFVFLDRATMNLDGQDFPTVDAWLAGEGE